MTTPPTTRPMTTVLGLTTIPPLGMSMPTSASSAFEQSRHEDAAEDAEAGREEPDHQRLAEHRAAAPGGRLAPIARSSASSRVRWATMIVNVL